MDVFLCNLLVINHKSTENIPFPHLFLRFSYTELTLTYIELTFFMKTNLKMFDDKGQIADFDGLRLAAGNRPGAWGLTAAADGAGRMRLRWELDDDRVVVNGDDRLMVALLYGDRLFSPVVAKGAPALRREKTAVVEVERRSSVELHLYCFFVSPGGDAFSDSQHVAVWTEDGDR